MGSEFKPIQQCKENPHYFMWRGKPTILLTSAEHYSAVFNRAFDNRKYLDTLKTCGFNHTRLYTGVKRETPGLFNIAGNPQAPELKDFICPWKRTSTPGAADGGNKFDLDSWDEEYFDRLRQYFTDAGERGVEIEFALFSAHHIRSSGYGLWNICPMNNNNNINNVGEIEGLEFHSLKHPKIVEYQDKMIRKLVQELNGFDNFHFEICNEPYHDLITLEWHQHIADLIANEEAKLPNQHMISINMFNGFIEIQKPLNHIDIYNFHYMQRETVDRNYRLGKIIGMNETGIEVRRETYEYQAWEIIFAGAALYNMLDYSYTVGCEDGTFELPPSQPGGGSPELRKRLGILSKFINSFEFEKMSPHNEVVKEAMLQNGRFHVLAEIGKQYGIYAKSMQHSGGVGRMRLGVEIPAGTYKLEVMETENGNVVINETRRHEGGLMRMTMDNSTKVEHNLDHAFAVSIKAV
ncbi:hypothetical protein AGMMS49546_21070 [Spirochaetia bacterium]|nr:hypothetical protein AGMMS49546_21070 [Spirochaetia bacterium]